MSSPGKSTVPGNLRFGVYEADLRSGELRKYGLKIPIEEKPFLALTILLQHAGQLVTREELRAQLWPADVFIDFDHSLNTVIAKVRRTLNDTAGKPRFVETVGRRGYRFMAAVETSAPDDSPPPDPAASDPADSSLLPARKRRLSISWKTAAGVAASLLLVAGALAMYWVVRAGALPYNVQRMRIRQLTEHGRVNYAGISPDGRYIVYEKKRDDPARLWVKQVATGSELEVPVQQAGVFLDTISFSPDGNHVYFGQSSNENPNRFDLYTIPVFGGPVRRVLSDIVGASVSPDGARIAFVRWDSANSRTLLMVANADGSEAKELVSRSSKEPFLRETPAWSPSGRLVAAVAAHNGNEAKREIVVTPAAGGETRSLLAQRAFGQFAWFDDRSLVAAAFDFSAGFAPGSDRAQIWYQPFPAGDAVRFTNDTNHYTRVAVSAARDSLVAVKQDISENLFIAPSGQPGDARQITRDKIAALDMTWISNEQLVLKDQNLHLYRMDADGSNRTLLFDEFAAGSLTHCGDHAIVFGRLDEDGAAGLWVMDLNGGRPRQLLSDSLRVGGSCSPDGKWVYYLPYAAGSSRLMKIPFSGGQPIAVGTLTPDTNPFPALPPLVSPDGTLVLFQTGWAANDSLVVVRTADASLLGKWPAHANWLATWGPDGKSIVYVCLVGGETTLWQQPFRGPARRIAGLGLTGSVWPSVADTIWGLEYSPDGKRLALLRAAEAKDIVLFTSFRR